MGALFSWEQLMRRALNPIVIEQPADEPITVDEARAHCEAARYGDSDVDPVDDAMFEGWIAAAREHCEDFLGLSLATKTLEVALDSFPTVRDDGSTSIGLPGGPVRQIVQIMIPAPDADAGSDDVDSDELVGEAVYADGQVHPGLYAIDAARSLLYPVTDWPSVTAGIGAVRIRYLAGYGVDSDGGEALPNVIRSAMLLVIGHLYRNRESTTDKAMATLPLGVESLLRPRRVRLGMA